MQIVAPAEVELEDPTVDLGRWQNHKINDERAAHKDHFTERDGVKFAGTHLLLDLWGAQHLDNIKLIENAMRECVVACGATLLHIHLHYFTPGFGVSGVAVLAESHISVHTWPEREFAAFDVFMCGDAQPENAIAVLSRAFTPRRIEVNESLRGRSEE